MNKDPNEKLNTLGIILVVLAGLMVIQLYMVLKSVEVMDGHSGEHARELVDELEGQKEAIEKLSGEVRRLQDQRKTADELRLALKEGLAGMRQQPVYVPVAGGMPTQPAAPTQPATPTQPARPVGPPTPVAEPEAPADDTRAENFSGMGVGDPERMPGPDPLTVVGGTYVSTTSEPSTLNYYTTSEGVTMRIMGDNILEPMFKASERDPTGLDKLLATDWSISDDKLTYTFVLRRGVTWSDGAPFSADDVVFTFGVIRDPNVEAESHRAAFQDIEAVEKVDSHTVRVKFKRKYWAGIYAFGAGLFVIPKHWYQREVEAYGKAKGIRTSPEPGKEGFGEAFNNLQKPCVGTGPYVMPNEGWDRGKSLRLERNDNWWRHKVEPGHWNLQTLKWRFISDHTQQLNQVRQQKIDVIVVKTDEWLDSLRHEKAITDNYDYYRYDHQRLGYNFIAWNCRQYPFDDARVRRAMTHLTDRAGLLRDLWRDNGTLATCPNKPIYPEYNTSLVPHPFDPERAAALLEAAGFEDADGDGVLDKEVDGERKPLEFVLKIPSGYAEYKRIASRMQQTMRQVGVKMTIHDLEWATFFKDYQERRFEAICLYNAPSNPWVDNYEELHSSEARARGGNAPGFASEELDRLVQEAREEFDRDKRIKLYHRIYEILHEEQPRTYLVHGRVNVLLHKRFRNVIIRHAGMRSTFWWVDPKNRLY